MALSAKGTFLAAVLALTFSAGGAQAAGCGKDAGGFEAWKQDFAQEAKAAGVKSKGSG